MIISRTPYRLSFFGGGTDYPAWYREEGGAVLSTTIDKYCYISCRFLPPFFNIRHRIVWSHIETVSTIAEILHPAVREGLRYLGFDDSVGVELHHQGDLPARAGIGSSSAFTVGLIKALLALRGQMISKHDLALRAIEFERDVLKEPVGSQDQVAAAYGSLNVIHFQRTGDIHVEPVTLSRSRIQDLESNLLLFYLGSSRLGARIAGEVVANLSHRKKELLEMGSMVGGALKILNGAGSLDEFGRLLHESWTLKRLLSPSVSNPAVDEVYETARRHGALGGKLLGAGGTGFMVFYAPPERQPGLIKALSSYLRVPFRFESQGAVLVYYDSTDTQGR